MTPTPTKTDHAVSKIIDKAAQNIFALTNSWGHFNTMDDGRIIRNTIEGAVTQAIASHAPAPAAERDGESDDLREIIRRTVADLHGRREEVLSAFIAKYGCQPDELQIVERHNSDGSTTWRAMKAPAPTVTTSVPTAPAADEAGEERLYGTSKYSLAEAEAVIRKRDRANMWSDSMVRDLCAHIRELTTPTPAEPQGGELDLDRLANNIEIDFIVYKKNSIRMLAVEALRAVQTAAYEEIDARQDALNRIFKALDLPSGVSATACIHKMKASLAAAKQEAAAQQKQDAERIAGLEADCEAMREAGNSLRDSLLTRDYPGDCPDNIWVPFTTALDAERPGQATLQKLRDRITALEDGLRPFATMPNHFDLEDDVVIYRNGDSSITAGDFIRAAELVNEAKGE